MQGKSVTLEQSLYVLALGLALLVRLVNLGAAPLSDAEANLALQALDIASAKSVAGVAPHAAYLSLTAATFALFGSTNFLARVWPALVGASLVLSPYFVRRLLGRDAAMLMAFGLALDPGLVATSRLGVGAAMAAGFLALALGLAWSGRMTASGILAALALLSGSAFWQGMLSLLLGLVIFRWWTRSHVPFTPGDAEAVNSPQAVRRALISGGITLILCATLFLRFPQGLSALPSSALAYLSGWWQASGVPPMRLLAALGVYQPLAVLFGLIGLGRAWLRRDGVGQGLSLWLLAALLLGLLYPGRQVGDGVWILLPVWALAGRELASLLPLSMPSMELPLGSINPRLVATLQAILLSLLAALLWMNLEGISRLTPDLPNYWLRWSSLAGVVALGAVITAFVGLGWTWHVARLGLGWGLCLSLGLYGLSAMWGVSQIRDPGRYELWQLSPSGADVNLLRKTLADLSLWKSGRADSIDVTLAIDAPSLRWALRDYPHLTVVAEGLPLAVSTSASIVITPQAEEQPTLSAAYRGQDFVWWRSPAWQGALPPAFPRWLTTRHAPLQEARVILWARSDLFPGGALTPESNEIPLQIPLPSLERENPR